MNRSSFHHGNLHASILIEAAEALRIHGIDGVSMREIAKRLGVTPRALYRHFENKDAVLNALAEQGLQQLRDDYLIADQLDAPANFRLMKVCEAYLEFGSQHPDLYNLIFNSQISLNDISASKPDPSFNIFEGLIGDILGIRIPSELRAQSYSIWCILHGHICLQNSENAMELVKDVNTRAATLKAIQKLIEIQSPTSSNER